jgi:hypothetical protein
MPLRQIPRFTIAVNLKEPMKFIVIGLLSLACISAQAADRVVTQTTLPQLDTTFECWASATGNCNYLIMTSICNETMLPTGQKQKVCQVSPFLDFTLTRGKRKLVPNLPNDYQYCMKMDVKPDLAACIANPIPH